MLSVTVNPARLLPPQLLSWDILPHHRHCWKLTLFVGTHEFIIKDDALMRVHRRTLTSGGRREPGGSRGRHERQGDTGGAAAAARWRSAAAPPLASGGPAGWASSWCRSRRPDTGPCCVGRGRSETSCRAPTGLLHPQSRLSSGQPGLHVFPMMQWGCCPGCVPRPWPQTSLYFSLAWTGLKQP